MCATQHGGAHQISDFWSCWTIVWCRFKMFFLSLSFCPLTEVVFRTFLYHCRMVHDDGGVWCINVFLKVCLQESEKNGDRTMNVSIEPFTRLIWFMTPSVQFKTLPIFLHRRFGHEMLTLAMVVICNEQQKAACHQKMATVRFRMIYQSFFSHCYFSRYNDSLLARFLTPDKIALWWAFGKITKY